MLTSMNSQQLICKPLQYSVQHFVCDKTKDAENARRVVSANGAFARFHKATFGCPKPCPDQLSYNFVTFLQSAIMITCCMVVEYERCLLSTLALCVSDLVADLQYPET